MPPSLDSTLISLDLAFPATAGHGALAPSGPRTNSAVDGAGGQAAAVRFREVRAGVKATVRMVRDLTSTGPLTATAGHVAAAPLSPRSDGAMGRADAFVALSDFLRSRAIDAAVHRSHRHSARAL